MDDVKIIDEKLNAIMNNKVVHAYLFEVKNNNVEYIYISLVKKILRREIDENEILCQKLDEIDNGSFSDLKIIEPIGNNIKKEQISDLLSEYKKTSILGTSRFYVIKYAEDMNLSAANSLLKFLEEPDGDVVAILFTRNKYSVLKTIVSRCNVINIYNADDSLTESKTVEEYNNYLNIIIEKGKNSIAYLNSLYMLKSDDLKNAFNLWLVTCQNMILSNNKKTKELISLMKRINDGILKLNYNINTKVIIDDVILGGDKYD